LNSSIHCDEKYAAILTEIVEAANENFWNKEKSDIEESEVRIDKVQCQDTIFQFSNQDTI
jgi:hypothetical protein